MEWSWKQRRVRHRRLVLLLDVSGSMGEYSRALLGFGYAAIRSGIQAEVFSFGTRVTRLTHHLRRGGADEALATVAHHVEDWDGGTLIGVSLRAFRERWGTSLARGAIVVICSDGLERGDPEPLRQEMARLQRLAHRVVWVNPLKGVDGYAPTARGMAAALPHVDRFIPGHNLSSLQELAGLLPTLR